MNDSKPDTKEHVGARPWSWVVLVCGCILFGIIMSMRTEQTFVGTWSNKKQGFAIITFGLRADGTGFYAPSMSQLGTLLRWKSTADGAELQVAAPPKNPILRLSRTDKADEVLLGGEGQQPERFFRIGTAEPPDFQKAAEERWAAEAKSLEDSRIRESRDAQTITELERMIRDFATAPIELQSASISGSSGRSISLNKTDQLVSIHLRYYYAGAKKLDPGSVFRYTTTKPETELQPEIAVPEPKQKELEQWLTDKSIKHETAFFKADGMWGIQAYYRFCSAYIRSDPQTVLETVQFILDHILQEKPPYRVSISKRKGA